MKKIIRYILLFGLIAVLGFAGFKQLETNKMKIEADAKLSEERNDVIPVITQKVGRATLDGDFEVVGTFAPYKQVVVMSETAGKARKVNFENGTYVKEGATLLAIDNDLLRIQLISAKTNMAKAENDLKRLNNLLGEGGVTLQQVEEAELGIDNLEAQIKSLEKQISMTFVRAPISGMVSNKMIEKGSLVAPAMQIATITNISRLKMQVYLTEEQVVHLKTGHLTTLHSDLFPDEKLIGKISFIDVNAGIGKRYLVEIELPNPENKLKAGMTGTVYFEGESASEVLAVPRESIVGNLQAAKIYVVENNVAVLKSIKAGAIFGNNVQVKTGLQEGETIVVSGQINLEDGMTISKGDDITQ